MHFRQLAIVVKDLEKSISFYETMAELTISKRFKEGDAELAYMTNDEGATEIELIQMPQMQKFEGKGFFVSFKTDKIDEMHALAKTEGLNPSDIRQPDPQTRYFYVYDPDGVSVQLRQDY